jgi:hypothetical protein
LDTFQKLIINTNNIEKVRESLNSFLNELEFNNYQSVAEKLDKLKLFEANKSHFEGSISMANDYLILIIEYIMEIIITNKVIGELEPHMFYLFESPESCSAQEVTVCKKGRPK